MSDSEAQIRWGSPASRKTAPGEETAPRSLGAVAAAERAAALREVRGDEGGGARRTEGGAGGGRGDDVGVRRARRRARAISARGALPRSKPPRENAA
jgi:hypothetical protein